jgi:hypothetical protein
MGLFGFRYQLGIATGKPQKVKGNYEKSFFHGSIDILQLNGASQGTLHRSGPAG